MACSAVETLPNTLPQGVCFPGATQAASYGHCRPHAIDPEPFMQHIIIKYNLPMSMCCPGGKDQDLG